MIAFESVHMNRDSESMDLLVAQAIILWNLITYRTTQRQDDDALLENMMMMNPIQNTRMTNPR